MPLICVNYESHYVSHNLTHTTNHQRFIQEICTHPKAIKVIECFRMAIVDRQMVLCRMNGIVRTFMCAFVRAIWREMLS